MKELIQQTSLTQAEKDYALKYLNVGTAASNLSVDNSGGNVISSSYIDIVDPMVSLARNVMTFTPQYALAYGHKIANEGR